MKKICFSLMILLMFCGAASAHIVYTTEGGNAGLIKISSTTSADLSANRYASGANSVVAAYWENNTSNGAGNSKIILITPREKSDSNFEGDTAVRFSSAESLSTPIDDANNPIVLKESYGVPVICGTNSGGSLYLATGASLREYKTSDFRFYNTYTYASSDLAPNPEIKAVTKDDNRVYVLVALNNDSNDLFITLDGTLNVNSKYSATNEVKNSKHNYAMDYISDARIVVGADDGVYHLTNGSAVSLVSSDYPVVALCSDTGSGFYYITQHEADGVTTNSLYHYKDSKTNTALISNITGSGAKLAKDPSYNVAGVMIGQQISLVNMDDDKIFLTYTSSNLSGNPKSITASSTTGHSADTSSGCNLIKNGELGIRNIFLLLSAFCGLLLMKIKIK